MDKTHVRKRAYKLRKTKYQPLHDFLVSQSLTEIALSFRRLEQILGFELSATALKPAFWVNLQNISESGHPCRSWLKAGYHAAYSNEGIITFTKVQHSVA